MKVFLARHWRKLICGAVLAGAIAALAIVGASVIRLLGTEITGAKQPGAGPYDEALAIHRTTPEGVPYSVNNDAATFRLDVAPPDPRCARLFASHAAAIAYCRSAGLPWIPSVQTVEAKCKAFDDGLVAALERAVQTGDGLEEGLGNQAALARLAGRLLQMLAESPGPRRRPLERALVHVAAALDLGGATADLPADIAAMAREEAQRFRDGSADAQPVGFWAESDDLRGLFRQDRFLMRGFNVADDPAAIVILSLAIARDDALARAFRRLAAFHARLTDPATYVDRGQPLAPQAHIIPFDAVASLVPGDRSVADLLEPEVLGRTTDALAREFGSGAGFALVAYAKSPEYALLQRLGREGALGGARATLDLIVDAVRTGRLGLEPRPDSGWYDFQWYALETLVAPERAREAGKLQMTAAYRERLKNAFRTILAKQRETHIKQLPEIYLCAEVADRRPRPRVEVGPEFSAEPTATVYLRMARGYRFLRSALHAVLGEGTLRRIRREGAAAAAGAHALDLDAELREAALRLYGLYEKLGSEIGQRPQYLEGEVTAADLDEARDSASRFLDALEEDPDLAMDGRVAVPIAKDPGLGTRYWATGGVKLERLVYEYEEEPEVEGDVEAVFVARTCYAPTDVFLEFDRAGAPLTREAYRTICDACADEGGLRAVLSARAERPAGGPPWRLLAALAAIAAACVAVARYRARIPLLRRRRILCRRNFLFAGGACAGLLLAWILALVVFPGYRTKVLVKYIAPLHPNLGVWCEYRLLYGVAARHRVPALIDLLGDPDPQVRYLAGRFITTGWQGGDMVSAGEYLRGDRIEARLLAAMHDPYPETAGVAIMELGLMANPAHVDGILAKLEANEGVDFLCYSALMALGSIGDLRALDRVLALSHDPRPSIRLAAVMALGHLRGGRAYDRLADLVHPAEERMRYWALDSVRELRKDFVPSPLQAERMDAVLLAGARDRTCPPEDRLDLAGAIESTGTKATAYVSILESPVAPEDGCAYVLEGIGQLGDIGPAAAAAVPVLRTMLGHPVATIRVAAREALARIEAGDPGDERR